MVNIYSLASIFKECNDTPAFHKFFYTLGSVCQNYELSFLFMLRNLKKNGNFHNHNVYSQSQNQAEIIVKI